MFLIIFGDDYVYFYHYLGGPLSCNQLLSDIFWVFKAAESKFKTINNASSQLPPAVALWWWNHFARIMTSKDRRAGCPSYNLSMVKKQKVPLKIAFTTAKSIIRYITLTEDQLNKYWCGTSCGITILGCMR